MRTGTQVTTSTRVVSELGILETDWRRLEASTSALTAFQTWEWVEAWWRTLGRRRPVHVVAVRRDEEVVAMTVLHPTRIGAGPVSFELFTPLGQDHADEALFVLGDVHDGGPRILEALGGLVAGGRRVVNLPRLREGGADHALASGGPRTPSVLVTEEGRATCPVLRFGTMPDPSREIQLRAKKADVPRLRRRLSEHGALTVELHTPVAGGFDELLDVYDRRWADRDWEQGLLSSPALRAFAREAATALGARDVLWLSTLRLEGRTIAACLGYRVGDAYLYHKPAFDPEFAKFGPGHILLSEVVAECLATGVQEFNLGRGEGGYKSRWATDAHDLVSFSIASTRMPAAVTRRLRHAALALRVREHRGGAVRP